MLGTIPFPKSRWAPAQLPRGRGVTIPGSPLGMWSVGTVGWGWAWEPQSSSPALQPLQCADIHWMPTSSSCPYPQVGAASSVLGRSPVSTQQCWRCSAPRAPSPESRPADTRQRLQDQNFCPGKPERGTTPAHVQQWLSHGTQQQPAARPAASRAANRKVRPGSVRNSSWLGA